MIPVDPALARHLQAVGALRIDHGSSSLIFDHFGDNAAVLTFHVRKRTDDDSNSWVPSLMKVEFLVGMNFARIGQGKFKDSFRTVTVSHLDPKLVSLMPATTGPPASAATTSPRSRSWSRWSRTKSSPARDTSSTAS